MIVHAAFAPAFFRAGGSRGTQSRVRVSTVTFSRGETTETDYEKRPESMDGDAGRTARTMQFLQWIYRPLRMADSITPTGVSPRTASGTLADTFLSFLPSAGRR